MYIRIYLKISVRSVAQEHLMPDTCVSCVRVCRCVYVYH